MIFGLVVIEKKAIRFFIIVVFLFYFPYYFYVGFICLNFVIDKSKIFEIWLSPLKEKYQRCNLFCIGILASAYLFFKQLIYFKVEALFIKPYFTVS